MSTRNRSSASVPQPRSPGFEFAEDIPRYWFGENAVATHVSNGVNLLFPAGERFFVRSVRYFLKDVKDPGLLEQIRGFAGQEGHHAREHQRFFQRLEAQGLDIQRFLKLYETVAFDFLERLSPPQLRLSTTAACEHYTAIIAAEALRHDYLESAHPKLRQLLRWHAAEEIEHRAVAFDVLQQVNPSYGLRVAGMVMATACLGGFWTLATLMLLSQERELGLKRLLRDWREMTEQRKGRRGFLSGLAEYLRPDFHPLQKDLDSLAEDYLRSAGMEVLA